MKHTLLILLSLFAAAILLRGVIAHAQVIASDGVLYIRIAKDISAGNLSNVQHYGFFNLYSFLIALFHEIFQNWEFSGKAVSVLLGSFAVIPLFLLARSLFNDKIAAVTALFYVVHPHFVEFSADVLREPVLWCFAATALWLAHEGLSSGRPVLVALSALSAGLAMFTRLEGAVVFFVILSWLIYAMATDPMVRRKSVMFLCTFVFTVPILASPFLIILKTKTGSWEFGHPVVQLTQLLKSNQEEQQPDRNTANPPSKLSGFLEIAERHKFVLFASEVMSKYFRVLNVLLLIFLFFGLWRRSTIEYSASDILLLLWTGAAFLNLFLYTLKMNYVSGRHALFMVLPALIWAAIGFIEVRDKIRKKCRDRKWLLRYARYDNLILCLLVLIILIPQTAFSYRYDKAEQRKAGIELRINGYSQKNFLVQPTLTRVAFYADADMIQLPVGSGDKALKELFAQHHDSVLLIDEKSIDEYVPELRKVIAESSFEKIPIPVFQTYHKYSFSLYRIR